MQKPLFLLINGPAGVGKSTLAEKIHADLPFSVLINIDNIKFSISQFRTDNSAAVALAVGSGLAMGEYIIKQGHSVILDRMIWGGFGEITKMKEMCERNNARFIHVLLTASSEKVSIRAGARGYPTMEDGGLNPEKIVKFHSKFEIRPPEFVGLVIDTTELLPELVYEQVRKYIG